MYILMYIKVCYRREKAFFKQAQPKSYRHFNLLKKYVTICDESCKDSLLGFPIAFIL